MKTSDWISVLASGAGPTPRAVVARRLIPAVAAGALASGVLSALAFGVNPALGDMGSALWIKVGYVVALAGAAAWLSERLSRPDAPARAAAAAVVVAMLCMATLAAFELLTMPPDERAAAVMGNSWHLCPWRIAALSVPALVALLWALRGLAPTRPRAAGLAAGLLAGALGALGVALYCTELSPAFVAAWYTLGIAVPAAAGALLGPRVLRW
jgi:hypothetical protein